MSLILVLIAIALIITGPLLVIWAINTIFGLGIEFTIWTWIAVVILVGAIRSDINISNKG